MDELERTSEERVWEELNRLGEVARDQEIQLVALHESISLTREGHGSWNDTFYAELGSVRTQVEEVRQQLCSFEDEFWRFNGKTLLAVEALHHELQTLLHAVQKKSRRAG